MRPDTMNRIVVSLSIFSLVLLPTILFAQDRLFTDFRGRDDYTAEELGAALFPTAEQIRTRGIAPVTTQPSPQSPPVKVSVALNVFFEFDSDKILSDYYDDLDKLGEALKLPQYAGYRVQIEGHTDSVGPASYNQNLSERRAASVKRYLVQKAAIDPARLIVKGYGENQPIASNETVEGRAKNRRVEVMNLGQQ